VKNKRRKMDPRLRPSSIEGTKEPVSTLKVVEPKKYFWIFVSRLTNDTAPNSIIDYLKSNGVESECERIRTKKKQSYSSFKVGIPVDKKSTVLDENFWPVGVRVNAFLNLKKIESPQGRNVIRMNQRTSLGTARPNMQQEVQQHNSES